jgi:hypothetical protein
MRTPLGVAIVSLQLGIVAAAAGDLSAAAGHLEEADPLPYRPSIRRQRAELAAAVAAG